MKIFKKSVLDTPANFQPVVLGLSGWCCCYCVFFSQKTVSNDFYDGLRREEMPTQTHLEPVKQVGMIDIDTLRRELRSTSLARKLRGIMKHCEPRCFDFVT